MTHHPPLDDEARDRIALQAVDALTRTEAAALEEHLSRCEACRAELGSLRQVTGDLALAVTPQSPPPGLRARVLAAAAGRASSDALEDRRSASRSGPQPWKTWTAQSAREGFAVALASDTVWEPTSVEGVEARSLFLDEQAGRVTMLVRMAPGASYPAHHHAGHEECYVIEGDLLSDNVRLRAGDYRRAFSGSTDGVQSTENGCLLLIVSSLHDELLPRSPA